MNATPVLCPVHGAGCQTWREIRADFRHERDARFVSQLESRADMRTEAGWLAEHKRTCLNCRETALRSTLADLEAAHDRTANGSTERAEIDAASDLLLADLAEVLAEKQIIHTTRENGASSND